MCVCVCVCVCAVKYALYNSKYFSAKARDWRDSNGNKQYAGFDTGGRVSYRFHIGRGKNNQEYPPFERFQSPLFKRIVIIIVRNFNTCTT